MCAQQTYRSDWVDSLSAEAALGPWLPIERTAKTDQTGQMPMLIFSLRLVHTSIVCFCPAAAHFSQLERWFECTHYLDLIG